ncbi:MAG: hypothetical protein SAL70_19765 [Scytonema sp. PMC 1070.18]|nr:hypothetical protein [Scytonema sp. PMC 1070.18]
MTVEEALALLEIILCPERINDIQVEVLRLCWEGRSYEEIAQNVNTPA